MAAVPRIDRVRDDLDRLKETFLTSLNHEIRTPLSGILGMIDLLLETKLDDEQREYVAAARLCAQDLFHILNATLEYAALEAGRLALDETEFRTRDLLGGPVVDLRVKAEKKGLRLLTALDPRLPETMMGDAGRIQEVIVHLVDNAVKFTHQGTIGVTLRRMQDRLAIVVRDTGVGIEPERRGQIFDSFRQGESGLSRRYPGLGLGLALVRKLVDLMAGEVALETQPGQGSTFTVCIPLRFPVEGAGTGGVGRPAILAVEDNPVGMMVLKHAFRGREVDVDTAASGAEAIAAARSRRYDLILMDLQMPDVDGLEATLEIRKMEAYRKVPILALTANYSDQMRAECQRHGMQGLLTKPIKADALWAAVCRQLGPARDAGTGGLE
jgi:CheY-like chemotaxis protein/anti-sigma regulatory factor (Ser/Thr protein kinase)